MPYDKQKSESYLNLGGINNKASPYATGPHEFLNLVNFDFSVPGALVQRPGSTQYINSNLGGGVPIVGLYEFTHLNGSSYIIVQGANAIYYVTGQSLTSIYGFNSSFPASFITFVDTLFVGNGIGQATFGIPAYNPAIKWDGTTVTLYTLPAPVILGTTFSPFAGGVTGLYQISVGFKNNLGYYGPPSTPVGASFNGVSFSVISLSVFIPDRFGINAYVVYESNPNGTQLFYKTEFPVVVPPGGVTFPLSPTLQAGFLVLGASAIFDSPANPLQPVNTAFNVQYGLYFTLGPKYFEIYNNQLFLAGLPSSYGFTAPIIGFTNGFNPVFGPTQSILLFDYSSRVYWTGIGQPEFIDPTYFAETRTNDGDIITGLKFYNNSLMIFKKFSFFQLFGNSETDILIKDISDQYGCLSNRAAVVYENILMFLDRKGICRYDGANTSVASMKIEGVFQRMNYDAALDKATAIHFKRRNEVWFNIPVDGSSLINMTVVYDYLMDAWTTFQGPEISAMNMIRGRFSDITSFYGDHSGAIYNFGSSLPSDNGRGITLIASTYFHHDMGDSVEKQWRRLYMNVEPITGSTASINVNLLPNYGTSVAISRTMFLNPFQARIDFGISAKSLQAQFTSFSATLFLKFYGYTIESRFQRNV